MATQALLLGAGFSKNFGLPLAKDILLEMFNRIKTPYLKTEILREIEGENDFEAYYSEKVKDSVTNSASTEVIEALLAVYKSMDEQVLRSFHNEKFVTLHSF